VVENESIIDKIHKNIKKKKKNDPIAKSSSSQLRGDIGFSEYFILPMKA